MFSEFCKNIHGGKKEGFNAATSPFLFKKCRSIKNVVNKVADSSTFLDRWKRRGDEGNIDRTKSFSKSGSKEITSRLVVIVVVVGHIRYFTCYQL